MQVPLNCIILAAQSAHPGAHCLPLHSISQVKSLVKLRLAQASLPFPHRLTIGADSHCGHCRAYVCHMHAVDVYPDPCLLILTNLPLLVLPSRKMVPLSAGVRMITAKSVVPLRGLTLSQHLQGQASPLQ